MRLRQFMPFTKAEDNDDGTLTVTGIASSEAIDSAGEIIRADAIRAALPGFFLHGTGALREMHQLSAAGTVDEAQVDDANKTVISATVVDPLAIKKIKSGVYKGFSIGGRVTKRNSDNRKVIEGLSLTEISLVDRPCCPDAVLDTWKVDSSAEDHADETNTENEMTTKTDSASAAGAEAQDETSKTIEPKPISPTKVGDVMGEGAGAHGSSTAENAPVAGHHVDVTLPGGSDATATEVKNPQEAGQATPAPLNATDTATIEHVAPAKPKPGTDQRTRKDAADAAGAVTGEATAANAAADTAEKTTQETPASDPVAIARAAADAALKAATTVMQKLAKRDAGTVSIVLVEGTELRKGLSTTGRLGYLLCEMSYILASSKYEEEMEKDDSPVPGKLRTALDSMAAAYKAMSDEELQELLDAADKTMGSEIMLAAFGGDLAKAFGADVLDGLLAKMTDPAAADDELAKAEGRITILEGERDELLKTVGGLTDTMTALSKKVDALSEMPAPAKTIAKTDLPEGVSALSKAEDTAGQQLAQSSDVGGGAKMTPEQMKSALDSMEPEARAALLMKAALHPTQARVITR